MGFMKPEKPAGVPAPAEAIAQTTPPPAGQTVGSKPRRRSQTATFLGPETTPTGAQGWGGKTLLGQ
jgi:hypothetical protein